MSTLSSMMVKQGGKFPPKSLCDSREIAQSLWASVFSFFKSRVIITALCGEHLLCPAEQPVPILSVTASSVPSRRLALRFSVHVVGGS